MRSAAKCDGSSGREARNSSGTLSIHRLQLQGVAGAQTGLPLWHSRDPAIESIPETRLGLRQKAASSNMDAIA